MGIADRKAREFKRREEEIIQAAFDLFVEHGIDSVTIDMIAEKAEVGKGTIYKHFTSKNEIFAILIIRQGNEILEKLSMISEDEPVLVQMKKAMRVFWEMTKDLRAFAVYRKCDQFLVLDDISPDVMAQFDRHKILKNQYIRSLMQRAVDEQIFRDGDIDNFVAAAMGLYYGVFDTILEGEVEPSDELYNLIENMIFKGFIR